MAAYPGGKRTSATNDFTLRPDCIVASNSARVSGGQHLALRVISRRREGVVRVGCLRQPPQFVIFKRSHMTGAVGPRQASPFLIVSGFIMRAVGIVAAISELIHGRALLPNLVVLDAGIQSPIE